MRRFPGIAWAVGLIWRWHVIGGSHTDLGEIEDAIGQIVGSLWLEHESVSARMFHLGAEEILRGTYTSTEDVVAKDYRHDQERTRFQARSQQPYLLIKSGRRSVVQTNSLSYIYMFRELVEVEGHHKIQA